MYIASFSFVYLVNTMHTLSHSYLCEPSSVRYFLIAQKPSDKNSHRPQRQFQVKPGVGKHLRLTVTRYESLKGRMFVEMKFIFFVFGKKLDVFSTSFLASCT